ncbi:type II toxin-antitoxin system RelE/ParE family toxin [Nodosilinea sp. LEGE 07088]|uniref:type II toxin-antitoxin system RelE/ParE family toxin n=1 Tax=Nodosilinea sp. LEGE 07088 TaxID=2777968 RepID=UPI001882988A|nr:type II toxin-antitoxin system RelE/ParE family toxin [Nodosilinea sp. LEGE 07088]MBE9137770.1 type II toxin-antitoxin system RelE/ParE family toxin [Nodosilinea sp. LEGE 07088]
MSRVCRITPRASQDIEAIADYLATQSSLASAETFLTEVERVLQRIGQFPNIGRQRDELYPNLRSFPHRQYLIFYRLLDNEIEVFRVVSGYQDLTALFEEGQ